jgi:Zn-finger nucleic acid-binding protein
LAFDFGQLEIGLFESEPLRSDGCHPSWGKDTKESDMVTRTGPMACPVDGTPLVMSERQSIEIDYCPTCRGVWLDRGELDKIIERSAAPAAQAAPPPQAQHAPPQYQQQPGAPWGHPQSGYGHGKPYKKRKSWLEEIFD